MNDFPSFFPLEKTSSALAVQEPTELEYHGRKGALFGIWLTNILLTILTLGIYSFWAKTRMRRYLTASYAMKGEFFSYTGTGKELFLGFLVAFPVLAIPYIIIQFYPLAALVFAPYFAVMLFAGIFSAARYRLSRTRWRGIRFHLQGSAFRYAGWRIVYALGNAVTLGLIKPYFDLKTSRRILNHVSYGSVNSVYEPNWKKVMKSHLITYLLFIPTLTLSRLWYKAALARHECESFRLGAIGLQFTATGGSYIKLYLLTLLVLVISLGLATPVVIQWYAEFYATHVKIIGNPQSLSAQQSTEELGKLGEGVEGIMDTGMDLGVAL